MQILSPKEFLGVKVKTATKIYFFKSEVEIWREWKKGKINASKKFLQCKTKKWKIKKSKKEENEEKRKDPTRKSVWFSRSRLNEKMTKGQIRQIKGTKKENKVIFLLNIIKWLNIYIHEYIYIHIYMCVCVRVWVFCCLMAYKLSWAI